MCSHLLKNATHEKALDVVRLLDGSGHFPLFGKERNVSSTHLDTAARPSVEMCDAGDGEGRANANAIVADSATRSTSELSAEYNRKFMTLITAYVVEFPALANIGEDVATQLNKYGEMLTGAEGRGDVVGMMDVLTQIQAWETVLEAKKQAFNAGEDPSTVIPETVVDACRASVSDVGTDPVALGQGQPMSPAEKQLMQEENEVQQRMEDLHIPVQKEHDMAGPAVMRDPVSTVGSSVAPMAEAQTVEVPPGGPAGPERKPAVKSDVKMSAPAPQNRDEVVVNIDDDEDGPVDRDEGEDETTYAKYRAKGIRELHPNVQEHPDALVETASLRSVPMPPLTFEHCLQEEVDSGVLSDAQLETVIYANMRFNQPDRPRMGFFLGDGAGVGKGRQIGALCKQHWHDGGRRILWVSVSQDLRIDTKRDLKDVNADYIPVHSDGSPPNGFDGVVFCTYAFLRMGLLGKKKKGEDGRKDNEAQENRPRQPRQKLERLTAVPNNSNLWKLIAWLSKCPEGSLIVLDESHKAKNLLPSSGSGEPTQTGRAIMFLQERLPDAKLLYSSATGASEPRNLAYMHRLGIGGVGNTDELVKMLVEANTDALELAAMSLKSAGAYLGRTLSYDGAEFDLVRVKLERSFSIMYDRGSEVWASLYKVAEAFGVKMWQSKFWGAHQRFFKSMLMAGKVPEISRMAKEALLNDMCVVIGLQSTGEAATQQAMSRVATDEMTDLISAPRLALTKCVQMMVNEEKTVQGLDESLQKAAGKSEQKWAYSHVMGYPDCDKISNILIVHKETYELARRVMDQPCIAEIESLLPAEDPPAELSLDDIERRIQDLRRNYTVLINEKNGVNLGMIACKDVAEKSKLRERVESMEREAKDVGSRISELQAMKEELEAGGGYFARKVSSAGCPEEVKVVKNVQPPQTLLCEYMKPQPSSERMAGYTPDDLHVICHDIMEWYDYIADKLDLPANPLDDLIHNLGGQDRVAELTGRKGGIFFDEDGVAEYRNRKADDSQFRKKDINLYEKNLFMEGKKLVAIISDASSTGISLQADRRVKNQKRRCHITLELPWSADKAIQQFGRSHRANQTSAPIYKMVVTPCGGEYRFACAASKRLASLGALLRGDRNALGAGSDLKSFDIDSELGQRALRKFLMSFITLSLPKAGKGIQQRELPDHLAVDLQGFERLTPNEKFLNYFRDRLARVGLKFKRGKIDCTVPTFLNRLLGFRIEEQELLFRYFSDIMELERELMINEGILQRGIVNMDVEAKMKQTIVVHTNSQTQSKVFHHVLLTDRGKSWEYIKEKLSSVLRVFGSIEAVSRYSGFYVQTDHHSGKDKEWNLNGEKVPKIKLVTVIPDENASSGRMIDMKAFTIQPYSEHPKTSKLHDAIGGLQRKLSMEEARHAWEKWYEYLDTGCIHGDNCKRRKDGNECQGRHAELHLLTGGLLEFFTRLREVCSCSEFIGRVHYVNKGENSEKKRHPLEIVRVIIDTGEPVVGYKAVSGAEMEFFKRQMLLMPGHEEDIVVRKKGTVHGDKAEERKRKEQELVMRNRTQKKVKAPASAEKNRLLMDEARRAKVSNPRHIGELQAHLGCTREEAIQTLALVNGHYATALKAGRAKQKTPFIP